MKVKIGFDLFIWLGMLMLSAVIASFFIMNSAPQDGLRKSDPIVLVLTRLPRPQGASNFGDCYYGVKTLSRRIYSCYFQTSMSFQSLKNFFGLALQSRGWQLTNDSKILDWGRDLGGHIVDFRKGNMIIALQFSGNVSKSSWQYALTIRSL